MLRAFTVHVRPPVGYVWLVCAVASYEIGLIKGDKSVHSKFNKPGFRKIDYANRDCCALAYIECLKIIRLRQHLFFSLEVNVSGLVNIATSELLHWQTQ